MKRFIPLALAAAVVCIATATFMPTAPTNAERTEVTAIAEQPATRHNGFVVYLDPATGNVVESRPGAKPFVIDMDLANSLSTSSDGLEEVASPVEGGGVMIDLQGRFRNAMVMVTEENAMVTATCVADPRTTVGEEKPSDEGKE
jgi:hypothetical protein